MQRETDKLGIISTTTPVSGNTQEYTMNVTSEDLEKASRIVDLNIKKEELEDARQDRMQRGNFSIGIFIFVAVYMFLALVILVLCGCHVLTLDQSVLITLLGTTTANVIGVFVIVANYLFHPKGK